jgi:hypothetical protein
MLAMCLFDLKHSKPSFLGYLRGREGCDGKSTNDSKIELRILPFRRPEAAGILSIPKKSDILFSSCPEGLKSSIRQLIVTQFISHAIVLCCLFSSPSISTPPRNLNTDNTPPLPSMLTDPSPYVAELTLSERQPKLTYWKDIKDWTGSHTRRGRSRKIL